MSDASEIFSDLNDQQIAAAMHLDGPALVVAGPGSGKTRLLTHRIAYLIKEREISENHILCVTFTNKAASEIRTRVENLLESNFKLSWSGTFHSICARILRIDGREIGVPQSFVIYDKDDQANLIKGIIKDFGIDSKKFSPNALLSAISSAKSELVSAASYRDYAQGYFQKTVASIYPEYQKRLQMNQALDFDDLLVRTIDLFSNVPAVLNKYQRIFKYILVDEYQDTNKAQYVLTKMLAESHKNLFVVGDMSQAIYSFRGADFRNILNFQNDYPEAKVYNLEQNYRSSQNILDAAKNIIKNNSTYIPLDLWTRNGDGEKLLVFTAGSDREEAEFVSTKVIEEVVSGKNFRDIAVLYRTNAQSRNIEENLLRNNIPYRIVGGLRFYSRKEIKDIIGFLRVIYNPNDSVSWERVINIPPRGIGQKSVEVFKKNNWNITEVEMRTGLPFSEWHKSIETFSTLELMEEVLEKVGYVKWIDDGTDESKQRIENIMELKSVAAQFVELKDFLENVSLIESTDKPSSDEYNAVTLMTVHASKGLEFSTVFMVGMEEKLFPHVQSLGEIDELEEERRLCYVAVTRAKEKLYLTHASTRLYFGDIQANLPSRFLAEIPEHLIMYFGSTHGQSRPYKDVEDYLDDLEYSRKNFNWN
ncbi:ATP-dependent DNA helicase PcrA [candidate division WWE3 bacterium]|uniref:DNA 3'-5' helicase n=1 Tax=candidate division WWE3 bacterium TaxID=2053526 RepID=A0A3A4ZCD1_UNCKA|nr:MAG: ATP-dependent DNA helicase PcrA [candidate division WWE3 bacterium]